VEGSDLQRAIAAGRSAASDLGLPVDDAIVVQNSSRIALHLIPCDVLARVAPPGSSWHASAEFEVEVARRLAGTDSPLAELEPRVDPGVHRRDGFAVTLWTYYEPVPPPTLTPEEYSSALRQLHAGLRTVDLRAPHFTDRVAEARALVADLEQTPELLGPDRELLNGTLHRLGDAIGRHPGRDQLLHGEPHPGNLLRTRRGLLFIDLETCCYGPVEFDIAHGLLPSADRELAADTLCQHYSGADRSVVDRCLTLIWAMITAWRWNQTDQLPNRDYWRLEGLRRLRAALDREGRGSNAAAGDA